MTWKVTAQDGLVQREIWRQGTLSIERVTTWTGACAYVRGPWSQADITDILVQVDDLDLGDNPTRVLYPNPIDHQHRRTMDSLWLEQGPEAWENLGWCHTRTIWETSGPVVCEAGEPPAPEIFGEDD